MRVLVARQRSELYLNFKLIVILCSLILDDELQFYNITYVMTPEIRQKKGPNWRAEPVVVSNNLCHTFVSITDTNFKWTPKVI